MFENGVWSTWMQVPNRCCLPAHSAGAVSYTHLTLPEDAPGGNTDSGPDISVYLRIYKFVNFFQKSACTVLES